MQMLTDSDIPGMASLLDLTGAGIPSVKAVVDHMMPPTPEAAPVPAMANPPSGTPAKVDPKTGLPAAGMVPVPGMSPVPMGAQSMLPAGGHSLASQAMYASAMDPGGLMPAPGMGAGGSWFDQEMVPGIKNIYLVAGAGAVLLLILMRSKRD